MPKSKQPDPFQLSALILAKATGSATPKDLKQFNSHARKTRRKSVKKGKK